jgi:hypothetical protein
MLFDGDLLLLLHDGDEPLIDKAVAMLVVKTVLYSFVGDWVSTRLSPN